MNRSKIEYTNADVPWHYGWNPCGFGCSRGGHEQLLGGIALVERNIFRVLQDKAEADKVTP